MSVVVMERVVFREDRCKGCEVCIAVCPQKIIALDSRINKLGYRSAAVKDQEACTSCGLCARVCPDAVISVYRPARPAKPAPAGEGRKAS